MPNTDARSLPPDALLQIRTVGLYLQRWGFMPQRPVKRALEQCPAKVGQWLKTEYPAIKTRAKVEDAEIY
jgi:hypothetical protein